MLPRASELTASVTQCLDDGGSEVPEGIARVCKEEIGDGKQPEFQRLESIDEILLVEMLIGTLWRERTHSLDSPCSLFIRKPHGSLGVVGQVELNISIDRVSLHCTYPDAYTDNYGRNTLQKESGS
jgi:hypothetical protein